jgi:ribosome-associated toxin RatA of RatAB toxin-antitoxin module
VRTSIGIRIAASPMEVFELAHDVSRWAQLLPHYLASTVQARAGDHVLARMIALRGFGAFAIPVAWRAVCWPDARDPADLRLHFHHVRGVTRGMTVTWHIRPAGPAGDEANVRIVHEFRRPLPFIGPDLLPRFIDRVFTRPIAGRTLVEFKRLAESAHPAGAVETNHTA